MFKVVRYHVLFLIIVFLSFLNATGKNMKNQKYYSTKKLLIKNKLNVNLNITKITNIRCQHKKQMRNTKKSLFM